MNATHNVGQPGADCHPHPRRLFAASDGSIPVRDATEDSQAGERIKPDSNSASGKEILEKAGVAVTPGLDFDQKRGNTTIRLSYARSTEDIIEGTKRLKEFMNK